MDSKDLIPILSLIVALLAVFVGPVFSWLTTKRQILAWLNVANKQVIAPMRQDWIDDLRDMMAELLSRSLHYYVAGFEDRTDEEYQDLTLLQYKISLMLNSAERDHREFELLVGNIINSLSSGSNGDRAFQEAHVKASDLAKKILKQEWNRVKEPISAV